MPFFDALPPEPEPPKPQRRQVPAWLRPNRDEVPVAVPFGRCLARTSTLALHLVRLDVYRDGVSFALQLDARQSSDGIDDTHELLSGGRGGALRFGLTLADGARCSTGDAADWRFPIDADAPAPPGPCLTFHGGGGGGDGYQFTQHLSAWLWPLPPEGPITLHWAIERAGVPEGSTTIEPQLRDLGADVLDVWED